jgi:pimeloyl-ACP methyl ester carboxylesterase
MKLFPYVLIIFIIYLTGFSSETITFPSNDGLLITADIYNLHEKSAPFIILFHQAGFSRGEYQEIALKLNTLGFNAIAIDQRSGKGVNGIINETANRAAEKNLRDTYLDAFPDLMATIQYVRDSLTTGKVILWGSSYSASLVLKIAGDHPDLMDGIIAFSPGEYFERLGESTDFISQSASQIQVPVFISSAKKEKDRWWPIYQVIQSQKSFFLPDSDGIHGSRALWTSTPEHNEYWSAVKDFLTQFSIPQKPNAPGNLNMQ